MPTYDIGGIPVQFPYKAYESQLCYITTVLDALKSGGHALLESPTGTGKTLCLLCATLAYRAAIAAKVQLVNIKSASYDVCLDRENLPRSSSEIKNTLSERLSVIGSPPRVPLIIYASRTHSQLTQVINELRKTDYRPKIAIASSREQLCTNPSVRELKSNGAMAAMCGQLVKKSLCSEFSRVDEAMTRLELIRKDSNKIFDIEDLMKVAKNHGACPFFLAKNDIVGADIVFMPYNYLIDKRTQAMIATLDLTDSIVIFDEAHNIESSCDEARSADISTTDLVNCLCEIDQVRDFMTMAMFMTTINHSTLEYCEQIARRLLEVLQTLSLNKDRRLLREGTFIIGFLAMANVGKETIKTTIQAFEQMAKVYVEGVYQKRRQNISSSLQTIAGALRIVFGITMDDLEAQKELGDQENIDRTFFRVFVEEIDSKKNDATGKSVRSRTLSYWCFNPGVAMRELVAKGIRSLLLTSGTLSPLNSFRTELDIEFSHQLENDHVVSGSQMFCSISGTGPRGKQLNCSYLQRDSEEYRLELGMAILDVCKITPDGVLVFFPSYSIMEDCVNFWRTTSIAKGEGPIFDLLSAVKPVFIEPKTKVELRPLMQSYNRAIEGRSGAIFFAVCRGKVSEGLDFSDSKCRATIVTGIPYPPLKDPRVILKRQYLDDRVRTAGGNGKVLSGDQWYSQQAARAINQAIGRVIRHKDDYGAILLLDNRFTSAKTIGQLSKWIRPQVKISNSFSELCTLLWDFFESKQKPVDRTSEIQQTLPMVCATKTFEEAMSFFRTREGVSIPNRTANEIYQPTDVEAKNIVIKAFGRTGGNQLNDKPASRQVVEQFLDQISIDLSSANRKAFMVIIKKYKNDQVDISAMISKVLDIFDVDNVADLRIGFRNFISARHRELYDRICHERYINVVPAKRSFGSEIITTPATLLPASNPPTSSLQPSAIPTLCTICQNPVNNGYQAKCGHVGCFSCWERWLQAKPECPLCRLRTRIPQLRKAFS